MLVTESKLYRRSLLGIRLTPFDTPCLFEVADWEVFSAGKVDSMSPEQRRRNINYQIQRGDYEKVLIRIYLDEFEKMIQKVRFHYLIRYTDSELAYYVMMAVLTKVQEQYPLSQEAIISRHEL